MPDEFRGMREMNRKIRVKLMSGLAGDLVACKLRNSWFGVYCFGYRFAVSTLL